MNHFLIISLVFLMSCNKTSKKDEFPQAATNSKSVEVKLIDSLGTINISLPLRYDTSYSWTHLSDCGKPCDEQKYRFQPKEFPLVKESGWIWAGSKNYIERFTISHSLDFPFHNGDTSRNIITHNHLKEQLKSDTENPPILFDTIRKINDRYFSIFTMAKSDTIQVKKVIAITTIKSNFVKFEYELITKKSDSISDNFIQNSINLIKTIRISKGI